MSDKWTREFEGILYPVGTVNGYYGKDKLRVLDRNDIELFSVKTRHVDTKKFHSLLASANGYQRLLADHGSHAQIVHRVNCHDKLVEALKDCLAELEASRCSHIKNVIVARAALELAKGGTHD